jgi:hypothetical protein
VLTRAAAEWGLDNVQKEADRLRKALRRFPPRARAETWLDEIAERWELVDEILERALAGGDQFQVRRAATAAKREVAGGPPPDALVALLTLLERLDAQLTAEQLARGDRADILQTVRWQADALGRSESLADRESARKIADRCRRFVAEWERRERSESRLRRVRRAPAPAARAARRGTRRRRLLESRRGAQRGCASRLRCSVHTERRCCASTSSSKEVEVEGRSDPARERPRNRGRDALRADVRVAGLDRGHL